MPRSGGGGSGRGKGHARPGRAGTPGGAGGGGVGGGAGGRRERGATTGARWVHGPSITEAFGSGQTILPGCYIHHILPGRRRVRTGVQPVPGAHLAVSPTTANP